MEKMRFEKGEKIFWNESECEVLNPLPNSSRYAIKTKYTKRLLVDSKEVFKNLGEFHESRIKKANKMIDKAYARLTDSKKFWENKIRESKEFLESSNNSQITNSQQTKPKCKAFETGVKSRSISGIEQDKPADTSDNTKKANSEDEE